MAPRPKKPSSIIAQVAGSGTALLTPGTRISPSLKTGDPTSPSKFFTVTELKEPMLVVPMVESAPKPAKSVKPGKGPPVVWKSGPV